MTNIEKERVSRDWTFWMTIIFALGTVVGLLVASSYYTSKNETEVFEEKVSEHGCVVRPYSVLLKEGLGRTCLMPEGRVVVEHPSKL